MKAVALILIAFFGCTDASVSKFAQLGSGQMVQCYSGGKLILETTTTGKVINETNSDGYSFVDARSGKLTEVSADCVFTAK